MPLQIKYELTGTGWADCTITKDSHQASITASYLSDALGDLAEAVIGILTNKIYTKAYFEEEPGQFRWVFEWDSGIVRIKIGEMCDNDEYEAFSEYEDEYYHKPLFESTCMPAELLNAMLHCLQTVYDTQGARGYRIQWAKDSFPLKALKQLKTIAKRKEKLICPIPDEVFIYWEQRDAWGAVFRKASEDIRYKSYSRKEATLEDIKKGLKYMKGVQETTIDGKSQLPQIVALKAHCYLTAAIICLWNGMYKKAFGLERFFLTKESQYENGHIICQYLSALIGAGKTEHLEALFIDTEFKKRFTVVYEAYVSYYQDPGANLKNYAWVIRNDARWFADKLHEVKYWYFYKGQI